MGRGARRRTSQRGAVYINSDGNGRGFQRRKVAHAGEIRQRRGARIDDPETQLSVWKRQQAPRIANAPTHAEDARRRAPRADLRIGALGSGSDYTAFLDHLGVASLDLGFGGEDRRRHLPFDLRRFLLVHAFLRHHFRLRPRARADRRHRGDAPGRRRAAALRFRQFHRHHPPLHRGSGELAHDKRDQIVERNRQIDEGVFAAIDDPRTHECRPSKKPCRRS